VHAIIRSEDAVLDQRTNPEVSKFLVEAHVIRAFVSDQAAKIARVPQGDFGPILVSSGHFVLQRNSRIAPSAISPRNVV